MPIKNYTTKVPAIQTVSEIQGILATHGAKKIMMDYGDDGKVEALTFALNLCGTLQGFRLVARPEGVIRVLQKERIKCGDDQAERIAWRNIKDWVSAQIALVEAEQASMEELFLPNLLSSNDQTLFEEIQKHQFLLVSGGEE